MSNNSIIVGDDQALFKQWRFNRVHAAIVAIVFAIAGGAFVLLTHAAPPNCTVSSILVNSCRPLYGTAMATQTPYPQVASDQVSQMLYQDQRIGHTSDIAHVYDAPGHNSISPAATTLINDGYTLMLNWKPASPWVDGSNGSDNAAIDTMAASLESVAPHKVMLVIWHEPENDVTPGGADCTVNKSDEGTAAQYVAMWHYTEDRLKADGVTNAVYVEYFQNYPPLLCNNVNQLYAGDNYVDWIGFDAYVNTGSISDQSWTTIVSRFYNFLTTNSDSDHDYLSKPWLISEMGIANLGTADAETWYGQAAAAITADTFPNLKAIVDYDDNNPTTGVAENRQAYSDAGVFTQAKQDAYNTMVDAIYNTDNSSPPPPDTSAPTASISSPASSATVSGTVPVDVITSDNVGVTKVNLLIDGTFVKSITSSPWIFSWDSSSVANGAHTLQVKAFDAAGNVGPSQVINVTVSNGGGVSPAAPVINSFVATPSSIDVGQDSVLSWSSANTTTCSVNPGGPQNTTAINWTTLDLTEAGTTTYTLNCQNSVGTTTSKTADVTVAPPSSPPSSVILSANSTTITSGNNVLLSWTSDDSTSCILNPGAYTASGGNSSKTIAALGVSTTYKVTCSNSAGSTTSNSVTVTVQAPNAPPLPPAAPSIVSFIATPSSVSAGATSTLSWQTSNVVSSGCALSPSPLSSASSNGSWTTPALNVSQAYTLTCENSDKLLVHQSVTVIVGGLPLKVPVPAAPTKLAVSLQSDNKAIVRSTTGQLIVNAQMAGTITVGSLITLNPAEVTNLNVVHSIMKVEYYSNNKLLQTVSKPPYALNSSTLKAGNYNVTERTYYTDGSTSQQTQLITLKAKPVARVITTHTHNSTLWIGLSVALVLSMAYVVFIRRRFRRLGSVNKAVEDLPNVVVGSNEDKFKKW